MPFSDLRVLLIEPNPKLSKHLEDLLRQMAYFVLPTTSGRGALQILRKAQPEIIIMPSFLSDIDVLVLLPTIRQLDEHISVLITVDMNNPGKLFSLLDQTVSGFIRKPIEESILKQQMEHVAQITLLQREIDTTKSMFERSLDIFPAHVALVKEDTVTFINRKFLDFLGFESYDQMRHKNVSLDSYISELNGQAYHGQNGEWLKSIINDPLDREPMVHMRDVRHPGHMDRIFTLSYTEFHEPGLFLVHLSDISDLQQERVELEGQANKDALTGAYRRRKFLEYLSIQEMYMATSGQAISLIMFDIDHFKRVNDTYGHDVGDSVLKTMCVLAEANIRTNDKLGRWGGEEFMILLVGADIKQAQGLAERLRSEIEHFAFAGVEGTCTASFGVGEWTAEETRSAFLKRIDKALYQAKKKGRNRVELA